MSSSNGPVVQHHTGSRLRAAALKLRHKLGHNAPTKQQDQPEAPLPTVPETRQLLDTDASPEPPIKTATEQARVRPDLEWLGRRDIFVQVVRATGLRAASISGTSDPQCKVILGSHISYTRSLKKVLDPDWNETFVFSLDPADIAAMNGPPIIHFEVWSHNEVAANDFLGEAELELTPADEHGKLIHQLPLAALRHKVRSSKPPTGQLSVNTWLGSTHEVLGRMHSGPVAEQRTKLSTLVRPFGFTKTIPLVVHSSGNAVYEEPCMAYLHIKISKVRGLITDFLSQSSAVGRPQVVQRSGSSHSMDMLRTSSSSQLVTPSPGSHSRLGNLFHRRRNSTTPKQSPDRRRSRLHLHKKHDSMSSDYNVQDTLHNAASGASQDGDSPRHEPPERPSPFRQWFQGNEPDWADEDPLSRRSPTERPFSDTADSETDVDTGSLTMDGPVSSKKHYYYITVRMGSQKHTTHLIHPEDDASLTWDSACTFVSPVPVRDRIIRLEVRSTSTRTKQGKVLAHAHIPLFQLIGFNKEEESKGAGRLKAEQGQWFRLHGHSKTGHDAAIVRLSTALLDADIRRSMYRHPWLSQEKYRGEVEAFEQRALQQGDTAEVVDLQAQQLEGGAQARTAQEGVMSWLHPDDPLQSPLASPSQPQAVAGDFDRLPSMESAVSATSQMGSSTQPEDWPGPPTPPYIPQRPFPSYLTWFQAAEKHLTAQRLSSKKVFSEGLQRLREKMQPGASDVERPQPGVNVPFGMLKVTLHGIDLAAAALCFCVMKVGPHWGRTATMTAATKATWNWEVHVPLYDPSTTLLLAVCQTQTQVHKARILTRAVRSMLNEDDTVLGKLRIRLSTLRPWEEIECTLPMLSDRDKGGTKVGQAHISLKVLNWGQRVLLAQYIKPAYPDAIYEHNLQSGALSKKVAREHERAVASWLSSANPPISSAVVIGVIDTQRWKFTMARARTNWKRLQSARATLSKYSAAFDGLQSWEHPEQSLAAIACTTLLSFYPHVMLAAFFLFLMFRSLLHYRGEHQGEPLEMEAEAAEPDDLAEEQPELLAGNTSAVANLRRKYAQLLSVALTLQNLLDDVATQLERLHSCITWQDPSATLLFIGFCLAAALGLALLGLPSIMAFGLFWMLRPPRLRTPTPPPPVSFFKRLPSVTDQLI